MRREQALPVASRIALARVPGRARPSTAGVQLVAAEHALVLEPASDRAREGVEVVLDDLAVELAKAEFGEQVVDEQEDRLERPNSGIGTEDRRDMAVSVAGAGVVRGDEPEPFALILAFDDELGEHAVPQLADERFRPRRRAPIPPVWRRAFVDRELKEEVVVGGEQRRAGAPVGPASGTEGATRRPGRPGGQA